MKKTLFFALFCLANAASLEDTIKGIDVSGNASYSFTAKETKTSYSDKNTKEPSILNENYHRFRLDVNFKSIIDDNFFAFIGVRYDSSDVSGSNSKGDKTFAGIANTHGGFDNIGDLYGNGWAGEGQSLSIQKFYLGYTGFDSTIITFGRQEIGSAFMDNIIGTGISVENTSLKNTLLWAYAFDNIEDSEDELNFKYAIKNDGKPVILSGFGDFSTSAIPGLKIRPYQNNLFGAGFHSFYEWFKISGEVAHLANTGTFLVGILGAIYNINDDASIEARINISKAIFTDNFKAKFTPISKSQNEKESSLLSDNLFFSAYLGLDYQKLSLSFVYSTFGKKDKIGFYGLSDNDYLTKSRYADYIGAHEAMLLSASYDFDNFKIGLKFLKGKTKNELVENIKSKEITCWLFYKYSDKMSYMLSYENIDDEYIHKNTIYEGQKNREKNNNFYFSANYSF